MIIHAVSALMHGVWECIIAARRPLLKSANRCRSYSQAILVREKDLHFVIHGGDDGRWKGEPAGSSYRFSPSCFSCFQVTCRMSDLVGCNLDVVECQLRDFSDRSVPFETFFSRKTSWKKL